MPGPLGSLYAILGIDARQVDAGLGIAEKAVLGFSQLKPEATLGADDSVARAAVGNAEKAIQAFDGSTAQATLTADTRGLLDDVEAAVRKLDQFDGENAIKLGLDDAELRQGLKEADALLRRAVGQEKQLLRLGIDSGPLVNDLKAAEEDIKAAARRAAGVVETEMESATDEAGKSFLSMSTVAKGAFTGVGAAAGLAAGSVISQSNDIGDAMGLIKARVGDANAETGDWERRLKDIHNANYGADYGEIARGLSDVETQLRLSGDEADYFVEKSFAIRDTWDKELNETFRASRPLMDNFKISGKQALDVITVGLQAGVDNGEDFLDTIQEYSTSFRDMGYDAVDFVNILVAGMENGARNSDQIADAVKEFDIRIRDGSAATKTALEGLGINYDDFIGKLGSGAMTGRDAMELINGKLRDIGDTATQEQIGVGLYGTKWEDAGAQAILSLDQAGGAVEDLGLTVDGAADRMDTAIYSGPTSAFEALQRKIGGVVNDITGDLFPVLRDVAPLFAGFGPLLTKGLSTGLGALGGLSIAEALQGVVQRGFDKVRNSTVVTAAGSAVGTAFSVAMSAAATGAKAIGSMANGILGMGPKLAASGTAVGTVVGGSVSAAMLVGIPLAAGMVIKGISDELNKQGTTSDIYDFLFGEGADLRAKTQRYVSDIDRFMAEGMTFDQARQKAREFIDGQYGPEAASRLIPLIEGQNQVINQTYAKGQQDARETAILNARSTMHDVGVAMVSEAEATAADLRESTVLIGQAMMIQEPQRIADDYRETMRFAGQAAEFQALGDARQIGEGIPGQIGQGMQQEANKVFDAASALREILKNGTSPESRAMDFINNGKQYVKLIKDGMNSEKDGAKETAQQLAIGAINTIEDAGLNGAKGQRGLKQIGIYYDQLLATGMTESQARVALAAGGVSEKVIDGLQSNVNKAPNVANAYVNAFNEALRNRKQSVLNAMQYTFGKAMSGQSPPKEGPLRTAVLSAHKVAHAYVERFNGGLKGLAFPALTGPRMPGLSLPGGDVISAQPFFGPESSQPTVVHIHINGNLISDDASLAELGRRIENAVGLSNRTRLPIASPTG